MTFTFAICWPHTCGLTIDITVFTYTEDEARESKTLRGICICDLLAKTHVTATKLTLTYLITFSDETQGEIILFMGVVMQQIKMAHNCSHFRIWTFGLKTFQLSLILIICGSRGFFV